MSRPHEPGIPAEFKYQRVKFYPFGNQPADSLLLTSDPWSFLFAWLTQKQPKRGPRRALFRRALYYADLAEGFYDAAEKAPLPTKATLAYYGMLNLVKCFLSVRGVELETQYEHHGLTIPHDQERQIKVRAPDPNSISIFHEFAAQFGKPVSSTHSMSLGTLCSHLPEIHEMAFSLGLLEWEKRKFLPLKISLSVNNAKTHVFTEVAYEKKSEARVPIRKFMGGARKDYFQMVSSDAQGITFRSRRKKAVNSTNWPVIYRNICRDFESFDIVCLLSRGGYLYYCDLRSGPYHHLCMSHALMFYLGTAARYRPTEMTGILRGEFRPLVTEALELCPRQFLYQLVSHTTQKVCVVPHAKL